MKIQVEPSLPSEVPNVSRLRPGEARCPAPSVQEIIARDAIKPPPNLAHEHYEYLGSEDIGFERYYSPGFFEREVERMWMNTWQWACREEHIPEPGDYYVYDIAQRSFLIVRTEDGSIKAYYNSCLHRGTKLRSGEGTGMAAELRCPFHGWTWSLSGELKRIPCAWDFPHVNPIEFRLPEVHVSTWGGFVFINPSENPMPLQEHLGVLPEHFANWNLADTYVHLHIAKEFQCNWKILYEAVIESYHVLETHPQLLEGYGDANVQYDTYGDHVSRFYALLGVNSPHLAEPLSEQQLLKKMLVGDSSVLGDELKFREGDTARTAMARFLRKALGTKYGVDLSRYSDSEMIDTIEYHVFPNTVLFPGLSLPMVHRFRPIGREPSRALFEIFLLQPVPAEGSRPPPAEVVRVKEGESYSVVPEFDSRIAALFDQEASTMRAQYEGMLAAKKPGETLGNYQEVCIRHFHRTLEKYINGDSQRTSANDR
jgi:phenylpropionate dioxygenase-like ring-hydroxylating dioxygenase large terminal subunit